MSAEIITQDDGTQVHVWTTPSGEKWCCAASDHGPLCRLCQPVDDTLDALIEALRDGDIIARVRSDGQLEFKSTAKGNAKAEDLISSEPEMADLWAQLMAKHGKADLNPSAEKVLRALYDNKDEGLNVQGVMDATGLTEGQVRQALDTLATLGFIGGGE